MSQCETCNGEGVIDERLGGYPQSGLPVTCPDCDGEGEVLQEPIIRIPAAPGDLKVGDYVFACRWGDADPGDPWVIGHVSELEHPPQPGDYGFVVVGDSPMRYRRFPKAVRITPQQAERILRLYPDMERKPTDYKAIAEVWGDPTNGSWHC